MFTQDRNGRYHDATTGRFVSNATVASANSGNYSSGSGSGSNSGYGSGYGSSYGSVSSRSYGSGYDTSYGTGYGNGYGNTHDSSNARSYLATSFNSNSAVNYNIDRNGRAHDPATGRYVSNSVLSQPLRESVYATPSPPAPVKTHTVEKQQNAIAALPSIDYKIDRSGRAHDPTTGRYVSKSVLSASYSSPSASSQLAPVKTSTPSEKLPTSASPKSQTSYTVDAKGRAHDAVTGRYVSQSVLSQPHSVSDSATRSPSRTTTLEPSSVEKKLTNKASATLQSSYTIDAKGRAHDAVTGRYISQSVLSQQPSANVKATSQTSSLAKNYSTQKNPTSPPSQISYKIDANGRYHDSITGRFISRASVDTANNASVTPPSKIKMSTNSNGKTPAKYVKGTTSNQMSKNVGDRSVRRSLAPDLEGVAKNAQKQVDFKLKDTERPRDRWGRYVRYSDHKNNSSLPAPEKNSAPQGLKDPRPRDKLGRFVAYANNPYRQHKTSSEESIQQNQIQKSHQEPQESEFDWLNDMLQPTHEQYDLIKNKIYPERETFAEANYRGKESFAEINYPTKENFAETDEDEETDDDEETESVTQTESETEWTEWTDFSEEDEKNGYTFKIIVENIIIFVNPYALAAYSPYFKELLLDDENELKENEMRLENDSYEDVIELLRCLFDDKPVEAENVAKIICLAKYYEVNALTALCIKFIDSDEFEKQDIDLDCVIVMLSSEFQLPLSQAVKSKLIKRVNAFSFTRAELRQQLKEIGLNLPQQIFSQCL